MINLVRSLFAWREVKRTKEWSYLRNAITGARRTKRLEPGFEPRDIRWMATGEWSQTMSQKRAAHAGEAIPVC